jgi:hypothetical protein
MKHTGSCDVKEVAYKNAPQFSKKCLHVRKENITGTGTYIYGKQCYISNKKKILRSDLEYKYCNFIDLSSDHQFYMKKYD